MDQASDQDLRISVAGLEVGMFVSRLDRPWIETPFPLHGLTIQDTGQRDALRGLCSFVWVDPLRGKSPDPRYLDLADPGQAKRQIDALRKTTWAVAQDFDTEVEKATPVFDQLEAGLRGALDELRAGRKLDTARLKAGVDAMVDSMLRNPNAFAWLREMRRSSEYDYLHAMGSSIWAASFGRHLGMERTELEELALGGLLCDVGKTRVPAELLAQKGPLDEEAQRLVKLHVRHGLEILGETPGISSIVIEMVATHHERHDGSGYPQGLAGNDIPIFGRIGGIVDSYDAMTSERPYAVSLAPHKAVSELYNRRGTAFQPEMVEQFIQACGIYPTGSLVELSDGRVGVITAVNSLKRLRPALMVLLDSDKKPLPRFQRLDLSEVMQDPEGRPLNIRQGLPSGAHGIDPHQLFID
ncbi:HD-GYP domain-containing protein [Pseudomarimonas salicorniae]|uniref:HD-GYP domain-containing protein n=1 Tax=Pseudomarimonas salicorniae TaxID=2933270 RepID=A0ABT0GIG4_9GAMM|nr:HD-GYP domain-containing protein [Lysobacter sp. CAU 1642]MCK7594341.1 HD-GYP domain-containing protein [Lysobacter sp. CAU 1642]